MNQAYTNSLETRKLVNKYICAVNDELRYSSIEIGSEIIYLRK
jgi:hypothetical protein